VLDCSMVAVKRPLVSVIVPTKNSAKTLPRLLESLSSQTLSEFELLAIDDESSDRTQFLLTNAGACLVVQHSDRAAARNLGAQLARGEVLVFVDSDMLLETELLAECATRIQGYDALIISEKLASPGGYLTRARGAEKLAYYRSGIYEAARCFRKSVFLSLGGYRAELVGLEDIDLMARLQDAGVRVGWTDSMLLHDEGNMSITEYLAKRRRYGRADRLFSAAHPEYWKRFRSPVDRFKLIASFSLSSGHRSTIWLLPGLVTCRTLEIFARISSWRSAR